MRILTISDIESKALWDHYEQHKDEHYDLIISAGDLDAGYLSFLTTMYNCDVLYVPGNHDDRYVDQPPEGCINIDGKLIEYKGLRIMGLGGSIRYNCGNYQYTEKEMRRKIWYLLPKIMFARGVDILVTHSPAGGFHDGEDGPHRGFDCIYDFVEKYEPKYFIHGHVHMNYGRKVPRIDQLGKTTVINAYERYVLDIDL